ncbi:UDP-3-O-(3-hydroxymyristoyl)glucosamine N-acyltransferase [Maribacter sp. ACAM166]|uniref:UDP-3-O-(3-hydroxymyristoyl)glucosamine N-acyltransferase n=1 Tax=Maribacter sp. ACAM166 TaxID=2508996 RepID=UPI0010FD93EF|nr:UDP-3-O-(3-hydroxymyristoyl)glucosamine N-acyltransferase [Maribacter sp. ACAM166]TLP82195.1 UDP-3-O-(3-hydroxymyristoyl)glucosamine N-acyltransferase [Maribacter sp. ACAM166]
MASYTINEINTIIKGELIGDTNQKIEGPEELKKASSNQITFIRTKKYAKFWPDSKACAALISSNLNIDLGDNRAFIKVKNVDLAMAKILALFNPSSPVFDTDIHPTAVIHKTAKIGDGCKIGANCYVGKDVELENEVILYPNVCVFDETSIGANTIVWSGTIIRERSIIGSHCVFHTNVSIGADGFGYTPSEDGRGLVKVPQIGNVIIGHYVEIGANSCVDRAKFGSTIVGDGCKIDNLVQIAHNSIMGRSCIMAGHSGLAGSVTLGDGVIIGGSASIKDHTTLHSGATIGAGSGVMNDVEAGKTVLGYPAQDANDMLRQWATVRQLTKKNR